MNEKSRFEKLFGTKPWKFVLAVAVGVGIGNVIYAAGFSAGESAGILAGGALVVLVVKAWRSGIRARRGISAGLVLLALGSGFGRQLADDADAPEVASEEVLQAQTGVVASLAWSEGS